jgi:general secretion pathway protein K
MKKPPYFERLFRPSARRGSALALTLLIVTILAGLAIAFSGKARVDLSLAEFSRDGMHAYDLALAGQQMAFAVIERDRDLKKDSLLEEWAKADLGAFPEDFLNGGSVTGRIVDENAKLNVNLLLNDRKEIDEDDERRLVRLFGLLGLKESVVSPILDWLDGDDTPRFEGAESGYYQALDPPYDCANGPFLTVGQIFLVKGVREAIAEAKEGKTRLDDYLTVYSNGEININTAPIEVLMSLDEGIDHGIAASILEYREKEDFKNTADLKRVAGFKDEIYSRIRDSITVKGSVFTVETEGAYGTARSGIKSVVLRRNGKISLAYWLVR